MSSVAVVHVQPGYRHETKTIAPGPILQLGDRATLKWYDIAPPALPVPESVDALARQSLVGADAAGELAVSGLGFVILHRCGVGFYFLLVASWAGNNELWETVWAKNGDDAGFQPWPLAEGHHPTFCVWELGAVWHEQQAWSRFLRSRRHRAGRTGVPVGFHQRGRLRPPLCSLSSRGARPRAVAPSASCDRCPRHRGCARDSRA